jgi:hypothetical protein
MELLLNIKSIIMKDNIIFAITLEDLQNESMGRIGRKLADNEIEIAKGGLEWGLQTCNLDIIYNTIFTEMI